MQKGNGHPGLGGRCYCVIPPLQPKTLQRLSLNARGRGTQGRAPVIAGAISQRLPCVGFFGIFLAETRKIPAGGTGTIIMEENQHKKVLLSVETEVRYSKKERFKSKVILVVE